MDSSNVFQVVPDFKVTGSVSGLDLLVISEADAQLVRHSLLGQPAGLSGVFQILPHQNTPSFHEAIGFSAGASA